MTPTVFKTLRKGTSLVVHLTSWTGHASPPEDATRIVPQLSRGAPCVRFPKSSLDPPRAVLPHRGLVRESRYRSDARSDARFTERLQLPQQSCCRSGSFLAATPIAGLSDEFDNAATTDRWERLSEVEGWNADQLNIYDIDATQAGRMVQQPHSTVWYQN